MTEQTPKPAWHKTLSLKNFTAFSECSFEFSSGINAFVGENGTGKTHVMKALYAWQMARHLADRDKFAKYEQIFAETYAVNSVRELLRNQNEAASVSGIFGGKEWSVGLYTEAIDSGVRPKPLRPVFIPAIEMMAHARNMNGILRDYADFDRTCFDFIAMVTAQNVSAHPEVIAVDDVNRLQSLIPGEVEWNQDEQRFYLVNDGSRLQFQLVAEGLRKISALFRLIASHWIQPGTALFWDEPEVNLNPVLMDEVVGALLSLARNGVQVFLATHSYVILKELDLQASRSDGISYFGFQKSPAGTIVNATRDFSQLQPNPILDQYNSLYDRELTRSTGRSRQK